MKRPTHLKTDGFGFPLRALEASAWTPFSLLALTIGQNWRQSSKLPHRKKATHSFLSHSSKWKEEEESPS